MTSLVKVARLHLVDRFGYTWLVWGVLALTFVINLAIFAVIPLTQPSGNFTFALVTIYTFMVLIGFQAATRFLPFAMTLGVSRRTYYFGTVLLIAALCSLYAAILTVLWALEGATNGWGLQLHYFRVRWVLDGPWYQVFLTNAELLALVFLSALWCGLIYRRFGLIGTVAFLAVWSILAVGAVLLVTWRQWWPAVGSYLSGLNVLAASGMLALAAVAIAGGGYLTIRRITV